MKFISLYFKIFLLKTGLTYYNVEAAFGSTFAGNSKGQICAVPSSKGGEIQSKVSKEIGIPTPFFRDLRCLNK